MADKASGSSFDWLEAPTLGVANTRTGERPGGIPGVTEPARKTRKARKKTGKRENPDYVMAGAYVDGLPHRGERLVHQLSHPPR